MRNFLKNPLISPPKVLFIGLILLISLVGFISIDIYVPSLPAIAKSLHVTQGIVQLSCTLYLCGFGISQLFYGPLSDSFGRRPVLFVGFLIFLLGTSILFISHSSSTLLIARLFQGFGAGAGASLCRVLLRDNFVGDRLAQISSYLTIGIALAAALAPVLGGFIQETVGFYGNFFVMLGFVSLTWILIALFLPETNKTLEKSFQLNRILKSYSDHLTNKIFIGNMACSGLALSALFSYAIISTFIIQNNLGLSAKVYGFITLLVALGELVGTYVNGRLVTKIHHSKMMFIGIIIMAIGAILMLLMSLYNIYNILSILLPSFLVTMSIGIIIPNATAGAFSQVKHSIGTAGSIYGFFQILVTIVTTYSISKTLNQTQSELGLVFLILSIASLLVYFTVVRNISTSSVLAEN